MNAKGEIIQDFVSGCLHGPPVTETTKTVGELEGVFRDEAAWRRMDPGQVVYRVQSWQPVAEGVEGGLFWGSTRIEPGLVGDEYFLTRGHYHARKDRGEYYVTVAGRGALVLMSDDRTTQVQWMSPGSTHYIHGFTAHRVVNTGDAPLSFVACWPSDAGHDYQTIAREGFAVRICRIDGDARVVAE